MQDKARAQAQGQHVQSGAAHTPTKGPRKHNTHTQRTNAQTGARYAHTVAARFAANLVHTKMDMRCKHPLNCTRLAAGPCFCRCCCHVFCWLQFLRIQPSLQDTGQRGQASANKGKTRTHTRKHAPKATTSTTPALPQSRITQSC